MNDYTINVTQAPKYTVEVTKGRTFNVEHTTGPRGNTGKSAYQVWLDLGNSGTESDFLDSLNQNAIDYVTSAMGDTAATLDIINGEVI